MRMKSCTYAGCNYHVNSRFVYEHKNPTKPPQTKCKLAQNKPLFLREEGYTRKSEVRGYSGGEKWMTSASTWANGVTI